MIIFINILKTVKRRVSGSICNREPPLLGGGADWSAEDGLGVTHRLRIGAQAGSGAPVKASGYLCTLGGSYREVRAN